MSAAATALPLPHDLAAEEAVLASVLVDPECLDELAEELRDADFAQDRHRAVYRAMLELHQHGTRVDPLALREALLRRGDLERAGGLDYITELLDLVPTAANAGYYGRLIRDRALERRLLHAGQAIAEAASRRTWGGDELVAQAERLVWEATASSSFGTPERVKERLWPLVEFIEDRYKDPKTVLGVASGLSDLDELTAGWRPGHYVVLGGRPSQGKTALALYLAHQAARRGTPTLLLSLEMGRDELVTRLLATETGLNSRRIDRGQLTETDWPKLSTAVAILSQLPLFLEDTPARTVSSARALTRRMVRREKIGLLVVDYVQLMRGDTPEENRQQEMRMISAGLKALARDLQIPVLVCCQLSREPERRGQTRPLLSDLRESGALEQDADVVILLWRNPQKMKEVEHALPPLTLLVAKQRNGPTGDVDVFYDHATGRFADWSPR